MAEKDEKDLPIREQEDGTVLVAVEEDKDPFEDQKKDEKAPDNGADADDKDDDSDDDSESNLGDDVSSKGDDGETDEDREKIREARREERKLKKELAKQREASAKHKISSLERRNEDLARRLAAVESAAASYQFAQVDKAIDDETTRVEYAKMKMMQSAQAGDHAGQIEYLEQLQESKNRLAQIQAYKKQQIENAKRPKQNVPDAVSEAVRENAEGWMDKHKWYDPQGRDTDSRIAKVIDQELAADGWEPSDPEYWDELDSRLASRLPHRYAAKGASKRTNPAPSGRSSNPGAGPSGKTFTLSRERVQAIKDAGAWDDPSKRNQMIKAYASYDRQNKG